MPSAPKIPQELILKTALRMLIRSGNASITIQSVEDAFCRMHESGVHFLQSLGVSRETENALE